jgi:deazaflavin-dependent oxidoreductase (nitroreductase family)
MRPRRPPRALLRLAGAPRLLYRAGLGRLLGHRFLQLTHRGRHTRRVYRTVLEVVRYDPARRESVVVSGWGAASDWYRNLRAGPALEVTTGGERYRPRQRFLPPAEAVAVVEAYARGHPWALRLLGPLLGVPGEPANRRAWAARQQMVAFTPLPAGAGR